VKKYDFLVNSENKQRFITALCAELRKSGVHTEHAKQDVDVLIVQTAVAASLNQAIVVVGNDTDLLVQLCFHTQQIKHILSTCNEDNCNNWENLRHQKIQNSLGPEVCNAMLFVHSLLGCDTTSRLFGRGKGAALKHL